MPQDELQQRVSRLIDAGASDEDIQFFVQNFRAQQPQTPEAPSMVDIGLADNPMLGPGMRAIQGLLRTVKAKPVESLATAGALGGVAATAPVSIPAAMLASGLGAAGGAGLGIIGRQLATGKPEPSENTLGAMAAHGAMGAAGEGIGRGVLAGANAVVPKVLKGILRPGKGVQQEFGDVVDVMRRERIPVGGSDTANARMLESAKTAKAMIADAEAAGAAPIKPKEVTGRLKDVVKVTKDRKALGKPDETPDVMKRGESFYEENKGGIKLTRANELKSRAQNEANSVFRAIDKGNVVKDTDALSDKAIAQGLRSAIESRVPGVQPVNARTQELMGLEQALSDAEARSGGVVGLNPANWLSGVAPGLGSKGVFAADTLARGQQAPSARLIRQALLSLLAGDGAERPE